MKKNKILVFAALTVVAIVAILAVGVFFSKKAVAPTVDEKTAQKIKDMINAQQNLEKQIKAKFAQKNEVLSKLFLIDLNDDGSSEAVAVFLVPEDAANNRKTSNRIAVINIKKLEKTAEMDFPEGGEGYAAGPGFGTLREAIDITGDKSKELIIEVGGKTEGLENYGIFSVGQGALSWLKKKGRDGKIAANADFIEGKANSSVFELSFISEGSGPVKVVQKTEMLTHSEKTGEDDTVLRTATYKWDGKYLAEI